MGDLDGAGTHRVQALEIGQATLDPQHPYLAVFRNNLDSLLQQLGR